MKSIPNKNKVPFAEFLKAQNKFNSIFKTNLLNAPTTPSGNPTVEGIVKAIRSSKEQTKQALKISEEQ